MEVYENWSGTKLEQEAQALFPQITEPGELWHVDYFRREPAVFVQSAVGYAATLADSTDYKNSIRGWLDKNFKPEQIQAGIVASPARNEFIVGFYPDWFEWFMSWRVVFDLKQWLKDTLITMQNLATPAEKENYKSEQVRFIATYAPADWRAQVPRELVLQWEKVFTPESTDIQTASMELKSIKNGKMIGWGMVALIGGVGVWALLGSMKKKRR